MYLQMLAAYQSFVREGDALFIVAENRSDSLGPMNELRERIQTLGPLIQDATMGANRAASDSVDRRNLQLRNQSLQTTALTAFMVLLTATLAVGTNFL